MKIEQGTEFKADGRTWFVTRHTKGQVCAETRDAAGNRTDWRIFSELQYECAQRTGSTFDDAALEKLGGQ